MFLILLMFSSFHNVNCPSSKKNIKHHDLQTLTIIINQLFVFPVYMLSEKV